MIGFPIEVLLGRLSSEEMLLGFVLQSGWLLVAAGLAWWLWRAGLKRYFAIGG
jgi:ABC-2 type transport system permease protein